MLTELQIRALKPRDRPYRIPDGDGLDLIIYPSGERSWVCRYKIKGRSGSIGLGRHPEVGAKMARALRDAAKAEAATGRKPQGLRAQVRAAEEPPTHQPTGPTLRALVEKWFADNEARWVPHFRQEVWARLEKWALTPLGDQPTNAITPALLFERVIEPLQKRSHDLARRCLQHLSAAWAHGIARGMKDLQPNNPALQAKAGLGVDPKSRDAKGRRVPKRRRPAIIHLEGVRAMLRAAEATPAAPLTLLANRFMALTAMRPGDVRGAQWDELHFNTEGGPVWIVPGMRMKMQGRADFHVPLSAQAMEVLQAARCLSGAALYIFPQEGNLNKPISENAVGYFLNRAGFQGRHCAHGWRAAFSSIVNERFSMAEFIIDDHRCEVETIVEACLAHEKADTMAGIYNRQDYLRARGRLMQSWADLLLEGMPPASALLKGPRSAVVLAFAGIAA